MTYTLLVIIHIRCSVHAIHTPLQSETVWYQPLCTVFVFILTCNVHLLLTYAPTIRLLGVACKKNVGKSFILSGKVMEKSEKINLAK